MTEPPPVRRDALLIASGCYHDIDFARAELLGHLGRQGPIRTRVREDYPDQQALAGVDLLISYTCDVVPGSDQLAALRAWLDAGGRWFALHGTNSILRFTQDGRVDAPDEAPAFMELLGSSFGAHPPIGRYRVEVAQPNHPLVAGIEPFEVEDELYLSRLRAPVEVLLHSWFEGRTPRFTDSEWAGMHHPVMYVRTMGKGAILYLTLGHCRGHLDMQPLMPWWPTVDRCSWNEPISRQLVDRGIAWAARLDETSL